MFEVTKEHELPWTKLKRVTAERSRSIVGKKSGLMIKIRRELEK